MAPPVRQLHHSTSYWLAPLLLLGLCSCGQRAGLTARNAGVVHALPAEEATRELTWESVSESRTVDPDSRPGVAEIERWHVEQGSVQRTPRGLRLRNLPVVLGRSGFPAERADVLEIDTRGLVFPGFVKLTWITSSLDGATRTHSMIQRVARQASGQAVRVRLDLRTDPAWTGVVSRLEMLVASAPGSTVDVGAPSWVKRSASTSKIRELARHALRAELDHEMRNAFLLPCGSSRSFPIRFEDPVRFDFGVGLPDWAVASTTLEVYQGSKLTERQTVSNLDSPVARTWRDMRLRVDPGETGREIRLVNSCADGADGIPLLVSNPLELPVRITRAPLIVLISIDTLRADRMSLYGYDRPTTPRLSKWAARHAVIFDHAESAAASTLPSHATMLTGLPVLLHGAYDGTPLARGFETIAERLRSAGYLTLAATGGGYVHPDYGFAQGFDRFHYWPRGEAPPDGELPDTLSRVERWLDRYRDWPVFLFLHTYEVHGPYYPRSEYLSRWSDWRGDPRTKIWPRNRFGEASSASGEDASDSPTLPLDPFALLRLRAPEVQVGVRHWDLEPARFALAGSFYDSAVARMDDLVGTLLERLSRGNADSRPTSIIFTADHGEALGEDELWGHGFLFETNLHVPLLVSAPGYKPLGERVERPVSSERIFMTIAKIAGTTEGDSERRPALLGALRDQLKGLPEEDSVYSYAPETAQGLAVRRGPDKLIVRDDAFAGSSLIEQAFSLDRDPAESSPMSGSGVPAGFGRLTRQALKLLSLPDIRGLYLHISNPSTSPAHAVLLSDGFRLKTLKWAVRPCFGCFRLSGPGRLEVRLPAGGSGSIRLSWPDPSLNLRIEDQDRSTSALLELAALCGREVEVTRGPNIRVSAEFRGLCPGGEVDPLKEDHELRKSLEALGYLH